jgi:hypothetical protein
MSSDHTGKTLTNERKYPFIVEVPVAAKGLKIDLIRQIVDFHKLRGIAPQLNPALEKVTAVGAFPIWRRRVPSSNSLAARSTKQPALEYADAVS